MYIYSNIFWNVSFISVPPPVAGWLHPTINIFDPEDGVDTDIVCANAKQHRPDLEVALSNSFGFGGHNSCVMFRKFRE